MTSFAVAQRTRQIGTRRALGADRWQILRDFLVENSLIAALGCSLGLLGAYGLNLAFLGHLEGADASRPQAP